MSGLVDALDVSRYDLLLGVIPSAFLLAVLADAVLAMPSEPTFAAASAVGALALADALFLNPPTGGRRGPSRPT